MSRALVIVLTTIFLLPPFVAQAGDPPQPDRVSVSVRTSFFPSRTKVEAVKHDGTWNVDYEKLQTADSYRRWRLPWQSKWVFKTEVTHQNFDLSNVRAKELEALLADDRLYVEPEFRSTCSDIGGAVSIHSMGRSRSDGYCQLRDFARAVISLVTSQQGER